MIPRGVVSEVPRKDSEESVFRAIKCSLVAVWSVSEYVALCASLANRNCVFLISAFLVCLFFFFLFLRILSSHKVIRAINGWSEMCFNENCFFQIAFKMLIWTVLTENYFLQIVFKMLIWTVLTENCFIRITLKMGFPIVLAVFAVLLNHCVWCWM